MSTKEIETTVCELQELRRLKEELEGEITTLEDIIKDEMGEREQMIAGAFKISWKTINSSRLDTVALKKALPEIAQRFMKQTTFRRFSIN